jgi:HD superfamily phosphodiesterase
VVGPARSFGSVLPAAELEVLMAAAHLHDIGYAPGLARTGLHPLGGARFLRRLGRERLACLVAHHSGARAEAEERGLLDALGQFSEERSPVADALTYCDLTTAADGARIDVSARLAEIVAPLRRRRSCGAGERSHAASCSRVRRFPGSG